MCYDQLETYYKKVMSTIPMHHILFNLSKNIKDIFIDLELLKETDRTVKASEAVRLKGKAPFFPSDPEKIPLKSLGDLIQLLIDKGHVVLKGIAGKGKTTLARKIAHDWTCQDVESKLAHFKVIFVLTMREIKESSGILDAIHRILPTTTELSKRDIGDLIQTYEKEVLIVFDGLDEVSPQVMEMPAPEGDFTIKDVLSVKAFRECSVLVTTRPHKMNLLWSYYNHYVVVETVGFSSKNRNTYMK